MRIRKHAKLAGLIFSSAAATAATDLSPPALQSHICHLNQSPWDAISFPPDSASSPYQVDGENSFTANASFGDSIGAVESVASMKIHVDVENVINNAADNVEKTEDAEEREDPLGFGNDEDILCYKSNGKGWQCKKEAKRGHLLCDHHLNQLRMYSSLAHPAAAKKSDKAAVQKGGAAIRRRPHTKKACLESNPYEFYYYSGFGPRWGKKRGTKVKFSTMASDKKPNAEEDEEIVVEATPSSSLSQIDNEVDEEFDYIEDEDDDEDAEEDGGFGKKRGRKPIKARSLKSLM